MWRRPFLAWSSAFAMRSSERPWILMSIWIDGDALLRAGDLGSPCRPARPRAEDVGQDGDLVAFLDEPHRHTGAGGLNRPRPASISDKRAAAHRGHRGGAVETPAPRRDADRVGELLEAGSSGVIARSDQGPVADLAPAGAAHRPHLARREGREVVVQQERLVVSRGTSMLSMRCRRHAAQRRVTSAWVWPRVNSEEPWVRGSTPPRTKWAARLRCRGRRRSARRASDTCFLIEWYCMSSSRLSITRPWSGNSASSWL